MTVTHIVAFRYKDDISAEVRKKTHADFLQLISSCKRESGEKYIVELIGGTQNISPEGAGKDLDHAFVVTFADTADRDWYVNKDPAHAEFARNVKKLIRDAFIYDFEH